MQLSLIDQQVYKTAYLSECGTYRYELRRVWDHDKPLVAFCGLNPSTADADKDDPTIRRCIGFAKNWGHGGIVMVNLFAYRATNPQDMKQADDPIGPENDLFLQDTLHECQKRIACWGVHGSHLERNLVVATMLSPMQCLGVTKHGHPKHPLYLPKTTPRRPLHILKETSPDE